LFRQAFALEQVGAATEVDANETSSCFVQDNAKKQDINCTRQNTKKQGIPFSRSKGSQFIYFYIQT